MHETRLLKTMRALTNLRRLKKLRVCTVEDYPSLTFVQNLPLLTQIEHLTLESIHIQSFAVSTEIIARMPCLVELTIHHDQMPN